MPFYHLIVYRLSLFYIRGKIFIFYQLTDEVESFIVPPNWIVSFYEGKLSFLCIGVCRYVDLIR